MRASRLASAALAAGSIALRFPAARKPGCPSMDTRSAERSMLRRKTRRAPVPGRQL